MNIRNLFLCCWLLVSAAVFSQPYDPVANPEAVVTCGNMRFTILTPEMIRIEWSQNAAFEDKATFAVVNRNLPVPHFEQKEDDQYLYINTNKLSLRYKKGTYPITDPVSSDNLRIAFQMDGREVVWYPDKEDKHNLKGTMRTLDSASGDSHRGMLEDGILSRSGWAVIDEMAPRGDGSMSLLLDSSTDDVPWYETRPDNTVLDMYFLGYGKDYKKALNDFVKIAGKAPMPPYYVFGYWYSKYEAYTEQDFKDIVTEVHDNDIPLDVMVIDTDWHLPGWTGWSWNRELIPDPEGLLTWMHDHQLKSPLNLHPSGGIDTYEDNFEALAQELNRPTDQKIPWQLENKDFYKAFFKHILRPHEQIGVDFWWLDWQQELLVNDTEKLGNTFWLNHVFYNDMKLNRKDRRPLTFHRWGGLGNHRYPIGFSGDMHTNFASLKYQTYFTHTASNVAYGYWSHDIGGHYQEGENDAELYLRWIQFGVFSPILRTHAANMEHIERRIWKYPNFASMLEAVRLRYALVPYIYTYARELYDTGVSLCRPMYYDYPDANEAYTYENQYMFGDYILASPIVEPADANTQISSKEIWFPEGNWYEVASGQMIEGGKSLVRHFAQDEIPYYYKAGAVIPTYPKIQSQKERPDKLVIKFIPGSNGSFKLYEDEGDNDNYQSGQYAFTHMEQTVGEDECVYTVHPVEGEYEGMCTERRYDFELLGQQRPLAVTVNDVAYEYSDTPSEGYWSYDEEAATVLVSVPAQSCHEACVVKVRFPENTGLDTQENKVGIWYNQSKQELSVRFSRATDATISLYNASGIRVFSQNYAVTDLIREGLAEYALPGGVYICEVTTADGKTIKKILL